MQLLGSCIGLILGGMISKNIFGALFGFFLGYLFDKNKYSTLLAGKKINTEQKYIFFYTTFQVMGYLSKSKGRVTETNIQIATQLMNKMALDDKSRLEAQRAFRQGKNADYPLRLHLRQLNALIGHHRDLLQFFLETQVEIAFSDGNLHSNSRQILYIIADEFHIERQQLDYYIAMVESQTAFRAHHQYKQTNDELNSINHTLLNNAYKLLNVKHSDDPATIKRAYRKLMLQYHPDKLRAKGLPVEMLELATSKSQDVQKAYDIIKRHRNFR